MIGRWGKQWAAREAAVIARLDDAVNLAVAMVGDANGVREADEIALIDENGDASETQQERHCQALAKLDAVRRQA